MIQIGDAISLVGKMVQVVLCRGTISDIRNEGGFTLATTDGVNYFHLEGSSTYKVMPKDESEGDASEYYLPFQQIPGLSFIELGSTEYADIYINLDDKTIGDLESTVVTNWEKMFKSSKIVPSVKSGSFQIICSDDEFDDVTDLVTDKKNAFSRLHYTLDDKTYTFTFAEDAGLLGKYEELNKICQYLEELVSCNFRMLPEDLLLNLNNHGRRSFQWEVWSMCNNLCTYCMTPDTKILMSDYTVKSISDVKEGDMVMGVYTNRFKLKPVKVLATNHRHYDGKLYGGHFTAEHPMMATRPNRKKYVEASKSRTRIRPIIPDVKETNNHDFVVEDGLMDESDYSGEVYNIQTESENYVADGYVVHNCYLGKENRHTDKARQMKSLNDLHKAIDNLDYRIYNNVSLIGGDFFQGQIDEPEVHDSFMSLIEKCAKAYHDNKLGSMWITCTLTIGDQHHLYEMLEIFKKYECFPREGWGSSGIWLCTSWDIKGRFHTPDRLENWDYHMLNIQKNYPWVKFNTTIILMEPFCQAVIDGTFNPREFGQKYKTTLFFKQVGLGKIAENVDLGPDSDGEIVKYMRAKVATNEALGFDFCPHRSVMLNCIRKFATDYPELYDRLFNIQYRADELHRNFNDQMKDMKTRRNKNSANETDVAMENVLNTCGHMINYMPYIDSNKCCICDKKAIWESLYG